MELIFLGTGSAYPSPQRGASSLILRHESGDCWMFDCGEGTQIQLMKSKVKPGKINKIFITHLHGDHLFGLPGLMNTLSMSSCTTSRLDLYGPRGLRRYLRTSLEMSRSLLQYRYAVHEILASDRCSNDMQKDWPLDHECSGNLHPAEDEGRDLHCDEDGVWHLFEDDSVRVTSSTLDHTIRCYGFVVTEADQPGTLDVERLKTLGLKPGLEYGKLKAGEAVTTESGVVIQPSEVIGPSRPGRKIVLLGDTRDSSAMTSSSMHCDVIVHESTLENERREDAVQKGHSTPGMAADFANSIQARKLILTHFSQRYKSETEDYSCSVSRLVDEAREVFRGEVEAADDLLTFPIPRR